MFGQMSMVFPFSFSVVDCNDHWRHALEEKERCVDVKFCILLTIP